MSIHAAFAEQAKACTNLGSPFMGRLLTLLSQRWSTDTELGRKFAGFSGEIGPGGHSLPLRLAGGLHGLVLCRMDDALVAAYPPNAVEDETLWAAVSGAMERHAAVLLDFTDNAPQTNELRRSAALIPVAHLLADRFGLPLKLSELGASGGLNMGFDHYGMRLGEARFGGQDPIFSLTPEWEGPLPPATPFTIADRRGVDLNPLVPQDPMDAQKMLAYLWPDQPERIARTRAAMELADWEIDASDAIDWLGPRLNESHMGQTHLIYHTVAWQYFPAEAQARGRALIETAGACATETAPLAWFGMENDGDNQGAALTLRLWPGDITLNLGRADFHGRWVRWSGA